MGRHGSKFAQIISQQLSSFKKKTERKKPYGKMNHNGFKRNSAVNLLELITLQTQGSGSHINEAKISQNKEKTESKHDGWDNEEWGTLEDVETSVKKKKNYLYKH